MIIDPPSAEDVEIYNKLRQGLEITNADTTKTKKVKVSGKEEGINIISTGNFYQSPKVDATTILNLIDDIYVAGVIKKQRNLIFNEKYTLNVLDSKTRKVDEELSRNMFAMCESKNVRLWAQMQRAYADCFCWGLSPYNPVWGVDKTAETNEIRLLKLRHLPPESFKTAPTNALDIYSPILQGIVPDDNGELTFYQEQKPGQNPELVKNIFYIKNPADRGFAGDPIIVPMVSILGMLGFTWNTQMEQVNRVGAKILFMRVKNPQGANTRNNNVGDNDYANAIIKNWGKDTAFVLRENFEIEDIKLTDDSNNLEIIDALNNLIIEYVTPASFISNKQETRLGGNDNAQKELLDNYIRGVHSWIEDQFEMLLMRYLEYNQYDGYEVQIHIPTPSHDSREDNRKDAESAFLTQCADENELRKLLGLQALDEAGIQKLRAWYQSIQRTPQLIKAS